jgi:hypothetical protein
MEGRRINVSRSVKGMCNSLGRLSKYGSMVNCRPESCSRLRGKMCKWEES